MPHDWPFVDSENVAVFTMRQIVDGRQPILLVAHSAEDGGWQFLTGETPRMADALLVSLRSMYERDRSIGELAALPEGWEAWRGSREAAWEVRRSEQAAEDD